MQTDGRGAILLDTHFWIWLQFGTNKPIKPAVQKALQDAAAQNQLLLSVISVWEVALLEAKGRIDLFAPCAQWVERALATPGLTLVPLTPEIAIESSRLPGVFHSDPADRIIAATARCTGARLLTYDEKLQTYARSGHLLVL